MNTEIEHPDTRKVYKYNLVGADHCHIGCEVPVGAKIIHVGMQGDAFVIWAVIDPLVSLKEELYFTVVGTGHDVPPESWHVGTVFQGPFVWHLFQENLVEAV